MTEGRSWEGNWKVRLYERVRERGYESLTAFAEAHPTLPLVELAQKLGEDDISAVQVFSGLVDEAERNHQLTRLMRQSRGASSHRNELCIPRDYVYALRGHATRAAAGPSR